MIEKLLWIALGGSIGAVLRFLIFYFWEKQHHSNFPWITLTINLLGSFLIGFLWAFFGKHFVSPGFRMFIFIGILGSFTTFSTFAFDVFSLAQEGAYRSVIFYIVTTNVLGIGLAFAGYYLCWCK
jgi:CrcB protein